MQIAHSRCRLSNRVKQVTASIFLLYRLALYFKSNVGDNFNRHRSLSAITLIEQITLIECAEASVTEIAPSLNVGLDDLQLTLVTFPMQ
jgi:hypothetical protein